MNIALSPEAERFVEAQLKSGHFQDASEVLDAAVRKLIRIAAAYDVIDLRTPKTRDELEASLLESIARFERGEAIEGDTAYSNLRKRIEEHGSK